MRGIRSQTRRRGTRSDKTARGACKIKPTGSTSVGGNDEPPRHRGGDLDGDFLSTEGAPAKRYKCGGCCTGGGPMGATVRMTGSFWTVAAALTWMGSLGVAVRLAAADLVPMGLRECSGTGEPTWTSWGSSTGGKTTGEHIDTKDTSTLAADGKHLTTSGSR